MMMPKTGKEARAIGAPRYFTGILCKRGHLSERYAVGGHCVECDNARERDDEERKAASKKYYEANKSKCFEASRIWRDKTGKAYEYTKRHREKNPGIIQASNAKRRSSKMSRTPAWLNDGHLFELDCIYRYCAALRSVGLDYEVDHVVPLQGDSVSGLHVPWNLQVISAKENATKGNSFGML